MHNRMCCTIHVPCSSVCVRRIQCFCGDARQRDYWTVRITCAFYVHYVHAHVHTNSVHCRSFVRLLFVCSFVWPSSIGFGCPFIIGVSRRSFVCRCCLSLVGCGCCASSVWPSARHSCLLWMPRRPQLLIMHVCWSRYS